MRPDARGPTVDARADGGLQIDVPSRRLRLALPGSRVDTSAHGQRDPGGDPMSIFSFFKRRLGRVEDKSGRREKPRSRAREGTVVLVIDDSKTILALMRKMLTENYFLALEALDAETGIEIARERKPDLIFLDIVLPGMNGFAALRILRRDPITKDIPVIMISGNAEATEQFYAQKIGADDFMKKPFARAELFARIERLFGGEDVMRRRGMLPKPLSL
jgi:twitching motility two-component system response regulator PilH